MGGNAKLAGHPVHRILAVLPIGLFAASLMLDLIGLFSTSGIWPLLSEYTIGAGIAAGLAATVVRATRSALWDAGSVVVTGLFLVSWLLRRPATTNPPAGALILSAVAIVLASGAGWLESEWGQSDAARIARRPPVARKIA